MEAPGQTLSRSVKTFAQGQMESNLPVMAEWLH